MKRLRIDGSDSIRLRVRKDKTTRLCGLCKTENDKDIEVIPCEYHDIIKLNNNIFNLKGENGNTLFNISSGEYSESFDEIRKIENLIEVKKDGKSGLLDTNLNVLLPCLYNAVKMTDGFILVSDGSGIGAFSENLEKIFDCVYDDICIYNKRFIITEKDGSYNVFDHLGNSVCNEPFDDVRIIYNKLLACHKDGKLGILDKNCEILLPFEFDKLLVYKGENFIVLEKDNHAIRYNIKGVELKRSRSYMDIINERY